MLHILFFILKIAGIILAVILGILMILVCIVLFVPVRYELSGSCEGDFKTLKLKVTVTWLLHLIRGDIYFKDQKVKWRLRAAWIKRFSGQVKEEKNHEERKLEKEKCKEAEHEEASEILESEEKIPEECKEGGRQPEEDKKDAPKGVEVLPEEEPGYDAAAESHKEPEEDASERKHVYEKIKDFFKGLSEKIKSLFQRIKGTFINFCDKLKMLRQKKDRLMDFITDEVHTGALKKMMKEFFRLLRRLSPKKLAADVRYGFSDPCMTGQVLAGLGILYPVMGEYVNVVPDFENCILKGRVSMSGKVHGYYFFIFLWKLIWCRDIRVTYKHIKNFEL